MSFTNANLWILHSSALRLLLYPVTTIIYENPIQFQVINLSNAKI